LVLENEAEVNNTENAPSERKSRRRIGLKWDKNRNRKRGPGGFAGKKKRRTTMQGKRPEKPWRRKCRAAEEEETLKLKREREREGGRERERERACGR
jgi:hypothetical protein